MFSLVSLGLPSIAQTGAPQFLGHVETSAGAALPFTDLPWSRVYIKDGFTGDAARRALRGASERLLKPACQTVFSEFRDGRGLPLTERLWELAASPDDYLRLVVFLDGGRSPQCEMRGVLAFTERNSRVVYLCGRDFERAERRDPRETQVTIIHELLHTLGLGENPPSPRDISFQVLQRCS
jgi:hypothetical protein